MSLITEEPEVLTEFAAGDTTYEGLSGTAIVKLHELNVSKDFHNKALDLLENGAIKLSLPYYVKGNLTEYGIDITIRKEDKSDDIGIGYKIVDKNKETHRFAVMVGLDGSFETALRRAVDVLGDSIRESSDLSFYKPPTYKMLEEAIMKFLEGFLDFAASAH